MIPTIMGNHFLQVSVQRVGSRIVRDLVSIHLHPSPLSSLTAGQKCSSEVIFKLSDAESLKQVGS